MNMLKANFYLLSSVKNLGEKRKSRMSHMTIQIQNAPYLGICNVVIVVDMDTIAKAAGHQILTSLPSRTVTVLEGQFKGNPPTPLSLACIVSSV